MEQIDTFKIALLATDMKIELDEQCLGFISRIRITVGLVIAVDRIQSEVRNTIYTNYFIW